MSKEVTWVLSSSDTSERTEGWKIQRPLVIAAGVAVAAFFLWPTVSPYLYSLSSAPSNKKRRNEGGAKSAQGEYDIKVLLKLDSLEAGNGCEKQVSFNATVGSELVQRTATLNIPAGVIDGHVITLKGWGGCHKQGGNCGDLLIEILVEGDDDYEKV
uniref:Chaperone DnaJ C-terminal domain-containing protein n=1 Tax=Guillardia theta TaxID=55529 RepID=A0A7S4PRN2_GUITH